MMSKRILIMDDGRCIKKSLAQMLKFIGYEAVVVSDRARAIELYQFAMKIGYPYDAFILDVDDLLETHQYIKDIVLDSNNLLTIIISNIAIARLLTSNEKILEILAEAKEASMKIRDLVYQLLILLSWPNCFQLDQNAKR